MKTRLGFQHPPDLNVAFPDFLTAVLKCAWLLAEYSYGVIIETAVEIISIFMLDSKYICLETRIKKKTEFLFGFAEKQVVLYYMHLESIVTFCTAMLLEGKLL